METANAALSLLASQSDSMVGWLLVVESVCVNLVRKEVCHHFVRCSLGNGYWTTIWKMKMFQWLIVFVHKVAVIIKYIVLALLYERQVHYSEKSMQMLWSKLQLASYWSVVVCLWRSVSMHEEMLWHVDVVEITTNFSGGKRSKLPTTFSDTQDKVRIFSTSTRESSLTRINGVINYIMWYLCCVWNIWFFCLWKNANAFA